MKYFLLLTAIVCFSCATAQETVRITQIESDDQIIFGYDTVRKYLWGIFIPFEFKFNNQSSQNLWIGGVDYCVPDEFGPLGQYGGWSAISRKLKINDKYVTGPYPAEFYKPQYQNPGYYWIGSIREITPESDIQDSLSRYVKRIKPGTRSIPVGTLREFKSRHPELTERLLGRDSVSFRVYNNNKPVEFITMPIKY